MCGIAGCLATSPVEARQRATRMSAAIAHRGPDQDGVIVRDHAGQSLALAHRRLSIIGLGEAGRQPMCDEDGELAIVFNGEIYNYQALAKTLSIEATSDTAVILAAWRRYGASCVEHFEGMFAFALHDSRDDSLLLARDPTGIKPLYWSEQGGGLAFASELQALIGDLARPQLDAQAVYEYLLFGSVQEPRTLIHGVQPLQPGTTLLWRNGECEHRRFWQMRFGSAPVSREQAIDRTRVALDDAVSRHFVSDVPVGVFLSGGIDSTALVSLARRNGVDQLHSFSIGFADPGYDESGLAARTAAHFGCEHSEWLMSADEGVSLLDDFLSAMDQPGNDGFNSWCVSRFARQKGLKVVLSGVGGDELFGGYASFQRVPQLIRWHPALQLANPLLKWGGQALNESRALKCRRLSALATSAGGPLAAWWTMRAYFTPTEAAALLTHYGLDAASAAAIDTPLPPTVTADNSVAWLESHRYMRNQLLRDSDAMSMAHGLELRVPFADRALIDAVTALPSHERLRPGKGLLVDAVGDLPRWVTEQPKKGFRFPFAEWSAGEWSGRFATIQQQAPVPLDTWYRRWVLLALETFIARHGLG
ncbi:asparagine synthase (glutamine-hydrolyzing) [Gammaproteobacteria bacterium]|nr:asparagine synthase (glutamine-hydrolyzing) [Gammaproteobacteria bacterium]